MTDERITDVETVRAMIAKHPAWYHQIALADGVVTPGNHASQTVLDHLDAIGLPTDCTGLRVLDIGCRDGFFSFEMERRGGEVVGVDYAAAEGTGFPIAAAVLGSRATYKVRNVYNLDPAEDGTFDVVLFLGILYHLRNPMLALDRVRAVTKPGGTLFVRTQVTTHAPFVDTDVPVWQFLPRDTLQNDASNKWAPNLAGLTAALEESQFRVLQTAFDGRASVRAEAVTDDWLEWHRTLDASEGVWGKQLAPDAPEG